MNLKIMFGNLPVKLELLVTLRTRELGLNHHSGGLVRVEGLREPPVETEVKEERSVREEVRHVRHEGEDRGNVCLDGEEGGTERNRKKILPTKVKG